MELLSADELLRYLIGVLVQNLQEIREIENLPSSQSEFGKGMKNAYVECLETIQLWNGARANGLDYDIESRFPVS